MIPFVYLITIVVYLILLISVITKNYILGLLSGMALMVLGTYTLIEGLENISTLLVDSLAAIDIGVGAYVLIKGSMEKFEEG